MHITLSVECSTPAPSVALLKGAVLLDETSWQTARGDSGRLMREIKAITQRHGILPSQISLFVAGLGPGGFTGLRTSVAAVRALALPSGAPATGVCSPDAVADVLLREHPDAGCLMVVGDARRDRLWVACYPRRLPFGDPSPVRLLPLQEAAAFMDSPGLVVATPDWDRLGEALDRIVPPSAVLIRESRLPSAAILADIALRPAPPRCPPLPMEPIYVHPPVFIAPRFPAAADPAA